MRKAGLIGAFGFVLLRLLKVKQIQICGSFFNSNELKGGADPGFQKGGGWQTIFIEGW